MVSPQLAALRGRRTSVRAVIHLRETDSATATLTEKADLELMVTFYKSAEQNAANEIELHELTYGGIEARTLACAHPERYVSKAPPPPSDVFDRTPRLPVPSREAQIARKKAELEAALRQAEVRKVELEGAIADWYRHALPEWDRTTADARTRQANKHQLVTEQYGALQSRFKQMLDSLDRTQLAAAETATGAGTQAHTSRQRATRAVNDQRKETIAISKARQRGIGAREICVLLDQRIAKEAPGPSTASIQGHCA